jgi:hypothetical protein
MNVIRLGHSLFKIFLLDLFRFCDFYFNWRLSLRVRRVSGMMGYSRNTGNQSSRIVEKEKRIGGIG